MKRTKRAKNSCLTAGLVLTGILAALILLGFFWTPHDPNAMAAGPKFDPPSLRHLLGTDSFGRDIFSRVLQGAGATASIALTTLAIGAGGGILLGALTGYFGGLADEILTRVGDVLTAFPSILLALVVISILGPGSRLNVMLSLGLVYWLHPLLSPWLAMIPAPVGWTALAALAADGLLTAAALRRSGSTACLRWRGE